MSGRLAQAVQTVLGGDVASSLWSTRAAAAMADIRREFAAVQAENNTLVVHAAGRRADWFTFAGGRGNDLIAAHLARHHGCTGQPNDLAISFSGVIDIDSLRHAISELTAEAVYLGATFDDDAVAALKFHECLPPTLRQEVLRRRFANRADLDRVLTRPTHTVFNS